MFKTPIRMVTILALCGIGLLTASGDIGAQDAPVTAAGFDGVWVMSTTRSSIGRLFTERTRISHNGQTETFESEIGGGGDSSGIRYTAPTDGRTAPFYDRITGKKRGTVTVTIVSASMTHIALVEDDPKRGSRWLEHWLSQDGRTYISLLKDQAGVVKSVLVFEKQPR